MFHSKGLYSKERVDGPVRVGGLGLREPRAEGLAALLALLSLHRE